MARNMGGGNPASLNAMVLVLEPEVVAALVAEFGRLWALPEQRTDLLRPHQAERLALEALKSKDADAAKIGVMLARAAERGWLTANEEGAMRALIRKGGMRQPDLPPRDTTADPELGW